MRVLPGFSLLCVASLCLADTLTLKNGTNVEGTYLGGTARVIRMEVRDQVQNFPIDSVSGVQFGMGGQSSRQEVGPPPPSQDDRSRMARSDREIRPDRDTRPERDNNLAASAPNSGQGFEIPQGTTIVVRMIDSVDSESARLGDTFHASVDEPVYVNGEVLVPRGADATVKLVDDQQSGKIQGRTALGLALISMTVQGRTLDITTHGVTKESASRGARSGKVIGGTAALGAIIGGIAGGGRGAAIGAGSGAAVGTGAQEVSRGQRVRIPTETRLTFTLAYPVRG